MKGLFGTDWNDPRTMATLQLAGGLLGGGNFGQALSRGLLGYQQTMNLRGSSSSAYMAFQNVGTRAVFGSVTPMNNSEIPVKASLPQTFLDVFGKQAAKLRAS